MKKSMNYCINCESTVEFKNGKCIKCGGMYKDVVPASYTNAPTVFGWMIGAKKRRVK